MASRVASRELNAEGDMHGLARKEAMKVGGALLKRAARRGTRAAGRALARAGEKGVDALRERAHRLPIQQSIDVAVPVEIAWEQWMEFEHLPEGGHRLADVERDGDALSGRIDGVRSRDWSAEVIDEREHESFAWRSTEGGDSAGLVTFHELGERLTRLEVTLDVQPEDLAETARLVLRIADRHVDEQLRSFKADAELLNPDIYDELLGADGDGRSGGEDDG